MYLGGLRLTIYNPELIFGPRVHRSRFHRIMFSIFAFMLSPFHTFFLHLQQFYVEVKSRSENADRALAFQRDKITYLLRKAVKFEFGLEGIFQMAGQFILFLNATSLTRTHEAFKAIFDEETPGERILLIFSVIWSFKTCILSHLKVVSASREHFPTMSKIVIGLYSFFAVSSRVLCMIMFFAPSLGLFNLLKHLQAEQTPWHPDLSNFVKNGVLHFGSNYSLDWNRFNRQFVTFFYNSYFRLYNTLFISFPDGMMLSMVVLNLHLIPCTQKQAFNSISSSFGSFLPFKHL